MQDQSQQLQEQLSAIMDGEASELELRRFLQRLDELNETDRANLMGQWQRYHLASDSLKSAASPALDIAGGVRAALEEEAPNSSASSGMGVSGVVSENAAVNESAAVAQDDTAQVSSSIWQRFAIAASLTLAVIVGFQQVQINGQAEQLRLASAESVNQDSLPEAVTPVLHSSPVQQSATLVASATETSVSVQDQQEAKRRLQEYLLEHANHAAQQNSQGIVPFARVANFESE